jgi:VIT1/CCC1 family predicted Fe2+/Mn2+ transporter
MRTKEGFEKAERQIEQGKPEQALTILYAEWARAVPKDEVRLAEFQRLVTLIQQRSSPEIREKAEPFLRNINRHIRGDVPGDEESAAAAQAGEIVRRSVVQARVPGRSSKAHDWVGACVFVLAMASVLSMLGGLLVFVAQFGSDLVLAVSWLIGGVVAAAVWLGAAVGLQLLSEAAQDVRRLAGQLAGEDED